MRKFWHHIMAILSCTDIMDGGLTDKEYEAYDKYMSQRGFPLSERVK